MQNADELKGKQSNDAPLCFLEFLLADENPR